jgi:hypothetical protein
MSFIIDWNERLQYTRMWLDDVAQQNNPRNYSKLTGCMNYLFSPSNPKTIHTEMVRQSENSEYRGVVIRYQPHDCDSVETDQTQTNCDAVAIHREYLQTVEPDLFVETKFTLTENYVRQNKEQGVGLDERFAREIAAAMRKGRESMDLQIFTTLGNNVGSNPAAPTGAGTYWNLPLISATDGSLDALNFDVIKNHQEDNYQTGEVGIIGLGEARRYMNRLAVGNVNDMGVDYREVMDQFGMALFKDHATTAALGTADRVLAIYPGIIQFYQYNLYNGDFAIDDTNPLLVKGTLADPIFPIQWDYMLKYDDGCSTGNGHQGSYTMRLHAHFGVYIPPEVAYGDTYCDLNDFNGIVGYNVQAT